MTQFSYIVCNLRSMGN